MESYTLQRLLNVIQANTANVTDDMLGRPVRSVSTDTRSIERGDVFFALKGERFDGAAYVDDAVRGGAALSVVNAESGEPGAYDSPVAVVDNTLAALGVAAADYRSTFHGTVVAVTGTSGKTTVKEMLLAVLGKQFRVHGTKGNYNNQIGLPLSLFGLRDTHECAVFELGMSAQGEIASLAAMCRPDIGVLLNVGPGHVEYFSRIEDVAEAKLELLEALTDDGIAIVNGDDQLLQNAGERTNARLVTFGMSGHCTYHAENIVFDGDGCARCVVNGTTLKLTVPGFHMVYNALAAFAVAREMGVSGETVAEALASFEAPGQRMERFTRNGVQFLNDTYNANPLSMGAAAEVVRLTQAGRKIAVLGDMRELGAMSDAAHRDIGRRFAETGIDRLCLVGESAGLYAEGAAQSDLANGSIRQFGTPEDAAAYLRTEIKPGDLVFVKGSRALKMERIIKLLNGSA